MRELLRNWDGRFVVVQHDRPTGATIYVAVHRDEPEAATGGTRMRSYPEPPQALRDALRLSEGMTWKLAALGLPRGGGKAVIDVPAHLSAEARGGLLDRYAGLLNSLRGAFQTGPDVGTTPADMDRIGQRASWVFGRTPASGGAGDPGPYTARGVVHGIHAALAHRFGSADTAGRTVLVLGLGDVGRPLAAQLAEEGATVIVSDVRPEARGDAASSGYGWVDPADALTAPCDVLAPCAVGGMLHAGVIPGLRCAIVAGSANNVLDSPEEDAARLRERDILYAPDFVINGGGAVFLLGRERLGWSDAHIDEVLAGIGTRLAEIFQSSEARGTTTHEAAMRLARRNAGDGGEGR